MDKRCTDCSSIFNAYSSRQKRCRSCQDKHNKAARLKAAKEYQDQKRDRTLIDVPEGYITIKEWALINGEKPNVGKRILKANPSSVPGALKARNQKGGVDIWVVPLDSIWPRTTIGRSTTHKICKNCGSCQNKTQSERQKNPTKVKNPKRKLGDICKCELCGKSYALTYYKQKRCRACQDERNKESRRLAAARSYKKKQHLTEMPEGYISAKDWSLQNGQKPYEGSRILSYNPTLVPGAKKTHKPGGRSGIWIVPQDTIWPCINKKGPTYKICKRCESQFQTFGNHSSYCDSCQEKRRLERQASLRKDKFRVKQRHGDLYKCEICEKEFPLTNNRQKYCPECRAKSAKQRYRESRYKNHVIPFTQEEWAAIIKEVQKEHTTPRDFIRSRVLPKAIIPELPDTKVDSFTPAIPS